MKIVNCPWCGLATLPVGIGRIECFCGLMLNWQPNYPQYGESEGWHVTTLIDGWNCMAYVPRDPLIEDWHRRVFRQYAMLDEHGITSFAHKE